MSQVVLNNSPPVGHECPSPPRMKIERLFSAELPCL
jgi:hypothetical protein